MQRTTALLDARMKPNTLIRVELWVAKKVDSLIYRMLVLNTGQVPWDLKRQLDTLYRPIIETVAKEIPSARIIGLDEGFRRSQAGEYRSTRIIELFLAFTSRSVDVDVRERVAEEFARIDITEATANKEFMPLFVAALNLMIDVDNAFDKTERNLKGSDVVKVKSGRDIFTSAPGSIGFMAAVAETLLGAPGFDYTLTNARKELAKLTKNISALIKYLKPLTTRELSEFLDLSTLNLVLDAKSSRIGEYQRNLYKKAFLVLLTKTGQVIRQGSMTPCWSAR